MAASKQQIIVIKEVYVVGETAKAFDARFGRNLQIAHWIPRSVLSPDCQLRHTGDHGTLSVPAWFAKLAKLTGEARP